MPAVAETVLPGVEVSAGEAEAGGEASLSPLHAMSSAARISALAAVTKFALMQPNLYLFLPLP